MNPLLISNYGTTITVDKRKLVVHNGMEGIHIEFQPHQIPYDSLIIDGHYGSISFEALRWLMKHGIVVSTLNWDGNLLSTTTPREPVSGKLKLAQYEAYLDEKRRYTIAESIIEAKIDTELATLQQLSRYYTSLDLKEINAGIARARKKYALNITQTFGLKKKIGILLMYEARVANIYWGEFTSVFRKLYPNFNFQNRGNNSFAHNMNASDEINALLNYGYAVLETEVRKAINIAGMDSEIGFIHEVNQGKRPLVYDLQELYRWIIDISVLQLLESKKLKKSDFVVTENYHIRLGQDAAHLLIDAIKLNFNSRVLHNGKYFTNQSIMYENIKSVSHCIEKKQNKPRFDVPVSEFKREDDTSMQNKILNLSPTERKQLGINKSTLWYMKKHINQGKRIKIYSKIKAKMS